jgi:hypothetical protein
MTLAVPTEGPLKQMTKANSHLCNENLFSAEMWWYDVGVCLYEYEKCKTDEEVDRGNVCQHGGFVSVVVEYETLKFHSADPSGPAV